MGLLGTLLGGSLGFFFFGPLGAILGGALGSNLDLGSGPQAHPGARTGARTGFDGARGGRFDPLQAQQAFLVAMISLAAKVAKADGRVTKEEVAAFDAFLKKNLGMPADERRLAARIFNEAKDSPIAAAEFARQIRQVLGRHPQRMRDMVALLLMVALADGHLHPAEESLIKEMARELGLTEGDYRDILAQFGPRANLDKHYATLQVPSDADDAQIKAAYRRLAKEYHPDVLANKGLGEDFQKYAAERMREVNAAYGSIKEARGF